jgi:hypothetical protein
MRKSVFEALVATVTGMESTFKANPIQFAPKILECLTNEDESLIDDDESRIVRTTAAMILIVEMENTMLNLAELVGMNDTFQKMHMELFGLTMAVSTAALASEYVESEDDEVVFTKTEVALDEMELAG